MVLPLQMTTAAEAARLGGILRETADRCSHDLGFGPGARPPEKAADRRG
jgi:hypothetical protein